MDEKFDLTSYNQDTVEYYQSKNLDEVVARVDQDHISWVIVRDCQESDRSDVSSLLSYVAADPALADEIFGDTPREFSDREPSCLFVKYMIPTPVFDPLHNSFAVDRGSMLMGDNYLLLFQETGRGFSDVIHDRLRAGKLRAQDYGVDYLLYLLLRAGIDQVGQLIDIELKNRFEALEDEVIASEGDDDCLDKLLAEREHVKALYEPLRRLDMFLKTVREGDVPFITAQTEPLFINNLKNDFERLEDGYTRLLEWWSQLLDLHRANVSESTDKIMNMLTIVSTIFLPITFITGFYGMNFINMPGVDNPYGFYIALLVMTASVLLTIIYMWKKGYFS